MGEGQAAGITRCGDGGHRQETHRR
jgi:hypothetical protein